MANTLLTISMITREALRILENNLTFTKHVRRDFDESFGVAGAKIGNVLNIRKPPRYVGRLGQALSLEDITETSVPLTLDTQFGVDLSVSSADLALSIDDFADRMLKPGIATVANRIDNDGLKQYLNIYNTLGTPGVVPADLDIYLNSGARLDDEAAPRDRQRAMIISPLMQAKIVFALKGLFQSSEKIAEQYDNGTMGYVAGFKWSMDQNVQSNSVGVLGGAPQVNGAGQTGNSLITNGWTAVAATRLLRGNVFTIAGVNAVNPQTRQDTGQLRQFVATADGASDGAGAMTIQISPSITPAGQFQTVTASPAAGALITVLGAANTSSRQGLAFHKDAFAMGCADLPLPEGVDKAARVNSKQLGMSIRMIRAYDINQDRWPTRLDILYGWTTLYAELACRVAS